jgi:hypothetical protein
MRQRNSVQKFNPLCGAIAGAQMSARGAKLPERRATLLSKIQGKNTTNFTRKSLDSQAGSSSPKRK